MIEVTEDMVLAALCKLESDSGVKAAIEAALVEYEQSDERREMDNKEIAKRNAELVDAIKVERASLRRKRDAAEQMLEALVLVRSVIAEAAQTGFNYKEGDWVERLYACQQVNTAAIRAAEGSK